MQPRSHIVEVETIAGSKAICKSSEHVSWQRRAVALRVACLAARDLRVAPVDLTRELDTLRDGIPKIQMEKIV